MKIKFICPKCKKSFILPNCVSCGYNVPEFNSIFQFCNDKSIKLDGDNKYIGYDNIGENFEPGVTYWNINDTENYGVYEICGTLIADNFGTDITVLDLGAGLGTASIPLAKNGISTIAADISNIMLNTAVKRSKKQYNNLIFTKMNAYNLMISDNSVDIVVENAMLHLVDNPHDVIKEIVRVLKPNGKLIRYGSYSKPITDEEAKQNQYCNSVLTEISDKYYEYLLDHYEKPLWFDNHFHDYIGSYFNKPYKIFDKEYTEVFVDKLKFRLHRLKTGAHSDLQHINKTILDNAWEYADNYAINKYGESYIDIKGFSKYGAMIEVYELI